MRIYVSVVDRCYNLYWKNIGVFTQVPYKVHEYLIFGIRVLNTHGRFHSPCRYFSTLRLLNKQGRLHPHYIYFKIFEYTLAFGDFIRPYLTSVHIWWWFLDHKALHNNAFIMHVVEEHVTSKTVTLTLHASHGNRLNNTPFKHCFESHCRDVPASY